jgi:ribosomal-protein-alanine N-acetyltransferase
MSFIVYTTHNNPGEKERIRIVSFLHEHLEEYGDEPTDINKAVLYALQEFESFGGFVLVSEENNEINGAVVINRTGMGGYIPENILVYIATHRDHRGKGLGKKLMNKAIDLAEGDIALHVEHNNPAKFLYEKVGFENPYLEMRLRK